MNSDPLSGGSPLSSGGFSALAHTNPFPTSSGVTAALTGSGYTQKPSFASTASGVNQSPAPPGQSPAPTATPAAALSPFDPQADPVVQQIRALGQKNVQQAQATELAGRKQELIDYGYDPALQSLYPDQSTADAAHQNPFSFLANAQHDYGQRTNTLEDALNKQNLFYSGYRGTQLGENAHNYQGQLAGGASSLQHGLGALAAALLAAQQDAAGNDLSAQQTAFSNYTPPETTAVPQQGDQSAPGAQQPSSIADLLTPQLPPFDVNATTLPPFDLSQTQLPTFRTADPTPLPAASTEQLPIYTGNPLDDQLLAELARPYARRAR